MAKILWSNLSEKKMLNWTINFDGKWRKCETSNIRIFVFSLVRVLIRSTLPFWMKFAVKGRWKISCPTMTLILVGISDTPWWRLVSESILCFFLFHNPSKTLFTNERHLEIYEIKSEARSDLFNIDFILLLYLERINQTKYIHLHLTYKRLISRLRSLEYDIIKTILLIRSLYF